MRAASAIGECLDAFDSPSILTIVFPSTHDCVVAETSPWLGVRTPGPSQLVVSSLSRLSSALADSAALEDLKGISRAFKSLFVSFGLCGNSSRALRGMLGSIELVSDLVQVIRTCSDGLRDSWVELSFFVSGLTCAQFAQTARRSSNAFKAVSGIDAHGSSSSFINDGRVLMLT